MSLIALFIKLDLDFLCVARTAPYHSWKNPVERIMSINNIGLQSVGLMREKADDDFEATVSKCKTMSALRKKAKRNPRLKDVSLDSIAPVKVLMSTVFQRLQLKGKNIECFISATMAEIDKLCKNLKSLDESITSDVKWVKAILSDYLKVQAFIEHCCQLRHYSFCVKKCGKTDCKICKKPRLPATVFQEIKVLPDPVPKGDGHYKSFEAV